MTRRRADRSPVRGAPVLADSLAVNDAASLTDHLGFARFAVPLADYIAAMHKDQTPWTVGIYGEWGSGKTSFLKQVSAELTERGIEPVWFNAWKYAREEDLWQALIQTVLDRVRVAGPWPRRVWVKSRIWLRSLNLRTGLLDLSRKLFWLFFRLGLIALALFMVATVLVPSTNPAMSSALKDLPWLADLLRQPWAAAAVAIGATLAAKPETLFKIFDVRLGFDVSAFQKKRSYREKVAFLEEFSEDFRDIIRIVCRDRPLVVVIDDLDRCLPEQTLQIVETMKLFLDVQGCVFLVAVDRDIIENAVAVRYKDLASQEPLLRRISETYFEKIVQLPFSLPPVTAAAADNLIMQISSDADVHLCLPVLRGNPPFNPRRIKRMVQTFTLLKSLAGNALSGSVVPPLLAKIVVIQTGYRDVYEAVIDDPGLLAALERSYGPPADDPADVSPARILEDERARQFAARHPDLPALFRHRLSPSDSFTQVSASEYLSFVRAVVPTEVAPESAAGAAPTFTIWHLRSDIDWAEWLARQLSDAGYEVQLGRTDSPRPTGYLVVVLSRQAVETVSAQQWATLRVAGARTLIARVAPVAVPEMLAAEQALDLESLREHEARAVLLSALDPRHRRPADLSPTSAVPESALPYPGRGVRVTNVRQPAAGLVGRRELGDRVAQCLLANRGDDSPAVCALIGMPGAGKSEVARHYAQSHADEYQVVWWIDGGEAGRIEAALRALAHELGGPERAGADPLALIGEKLASTRRWLLILDGAADPETVRPFLPLTGSGDVLVTTRRQSWAQTTRHIDVGPFDGDQALTFLTRQRPEEPEEELRALATALGHLPSALDAAARYLRLVVLPVHEFRRRLAEDDRTLVERSELLSGIRLLPAEVGPLAFVAPEPFPRVLAEASDETLGLLHEHSLAELTPGTVRLHPLVQLAARTVLSDEQSREVVLRAIGTTDSAVHLAVLVRHGSRLNVAAEAMRAGLVAAARGLLDAGRYVEAGEVARLAGDAGRTLLGEAVLNLGGGAAAVPLLADAPDLLVRAYLQAGDIEAALTVQNQRGGSDLAAMVGLAAINREGRPQVAQQLLGPTIEAYRQQRPDDALVARALVVLAGAEMQMDDLAAARRRYEEALEVQSRVLRPGHPDIAETLRPYAAVLASLHEPALARDRLREAIALWEAVVGPRDRLLLAFWRQLGDVASDLGDDDTLAEARRHLTDEPTSAVHSLTVSYQPTG